MSLLDLEVEFEPEREVWNVYEVYDGTVLRVKSLLLKLFRRGQAGSVQEADGAYSGRFRSVIAVKRANPGLKRFESSAAFTPREAQRLPRINEEFAALSEDWNSYRLETGDLLKVKPVVTLVHRVVGAWDEFDDPVYEVSSTYVVQAVKKFSGAGAYDAGQDR